MTKEELQKQDEEYEIVKQSTLRMVLESTNKGTLNGRISFAKTVIGMIDKGTPISVIRQVCNGIATNSEDVIVEDGNGGYSVKRGKRKRA